VTATKQPGFEASVRRRNGTAILDLRGELDAPGEDALHGAYTAAVESSPARVVLNFGGVSYINSKGIALIVGLMARARQQGRRLTAYGLSDHYREIFTITRLADYMSIYPDEAAALAVESDRQGGGHGAGAGASAANGAAGGAAGSGR
jgi:anti-anti-sigma factor